MVEALVMGLARFVGSSGACLRARSTLRGHGQAPRHAGLTFRRVPEGQGTRGAAPGGAQRSREAGKAEARHPSGASMCRGASLFRVPARTSQQAWGSMKRVDAADMRAYATIRGNRLVSLRSSPAPHFPTGGLDVASGYD